MKYTSITCQIEIFGSLYSNSFQEQMPLVQAIDLQLLRFKLFQISAILLEVSSLCTGTGWNSWLMNFDLVFLTDSFFSKMKPSEFTSFIAFYIEVAMVNRIENGNESPICWMTTNIIEIQMVDFSQWVKELNQQ